VKGDNGLMDYEKNMHEEDNRDNKESENDKNEQIRETGNLCLDHNQQNHKIYLLTIIGEIEGHETASGSSKTTKYEHVIPKLAEIEDSEEIEGVLILLNTLGGDVEAGLSIAEMIASLSKPTVSLVLGGCHSIGGPLAVAADYTFIVPSGTMVIHPVRSSGLFIGVIQSYRNIEKTQDRITSFISEHSNISQQRVEELMMDSTQLVKDIGTMLESQQAVKEGLIDEVGGMSQALTKLHEMIEERRNNE
jgi:ATP-dependent protease ClpP protease subunit